jgi:cobalt-zinc-cadmium efflux system protein
VADHHHHGHGHVHETDDARRLGLALGLIASLMAAEIVAGIVAHSLALIADAAHMLTDAGALLLALVVLQLVRRPARGNLTFGLRRAEILSAQANGATLLVLAGLIVYGGIRHLIDPPNPSGWTMVVVAVAGAIVAAVATWVLAGASRESLNVEGAFQHVATDFVAFAATAVAGLLIVTTGFVRADGLAALFVAAVMIRSAIGLLRQSGRVLLEAAPPGMEVDEIGTALAAHAHVVEVHDLHVWELGAGFPSLSAHVLVEAGADCHGIRRELEAILRERFLIEHTTLQVDHASAKGLLGIGRPRRRNLGT